jgi:hypothetical protein
MFYKNNKITVYQSHIDVASDNFLHTIHPRPDQEGICYITAFAEMPTIPRECEINRARSIPFELIPMIISYAIEDFLIEIECDCRIKVKLDPLLCSSLYPYGITESDGALSF